MFNGLYYKLGEEPAPLPQGAYGINADGEKWFFSPLNTQEAIDACGLIQAPDQPQYNPLMETVEWDTDHWNVVPLSDEKILDGVNKRRDALLSALSATRWMKQQTFTYNGKEAQSDDVTIGRIVAKVIAAQVTQDYTTKSVWKFGADNFAEVTVQEITAYGVAIGGHVQACFDYELTIVNQLKDALTHEALELVDIYSGWPN